MELLGVVRTVGALTRPPPFRAPVAGSPALPLRVQASRYFMVGTRCTYRVSACVCD